jgi:hypothetical protein
MGVEIARAGIEEPGRILSVRCTCAKTGAPGQERGDRIRRQQRTKATPTDTHLSALLPGPLRRWVTQRTTPKGTISAGAAAATSAASAFLDFASSRAKVLDLLRNRN